MVWPRGASVLLPTAHLKHAETLPIRWVCFLARRRGLRSQQHRASHHSSGTWARQEDTDLEKTWGPRLILTQNAAALSVFHSVRRCGFHSPQGASDLCHLGLRRQLSCGKPVVFWSGRVQCDWQAGWVPLETRKLRRSYCVSSRRTGGHSCLVDFLLSLWKLAQ